MNEAGLVVLEVRSSNAERVFLEVVPMLSKGLLRWNAQGLVHVFALSELVVLASRRGLERFLSGDPSSRFVDRRRALSRVRLLLGLVLG